MIPTDIGTKNRKFCYICMLIPFVIKNIVNMKKILLAIVAICFAGFCANAQSMTSGWKVSAFGGLYNASYANTHDRVGTFELGFGRQINSYVYAGVQAGVWGPVESDINDPIYQVPVSAVVEFDLPTQSRFTPLINLQAGTTVAAFGDNLEKFPDGTKPSYSIMSILPGVACNLSEHFSLKANVGYSYMNVADNKPGHNQKNLVARIGLVYNL